MLRNFARLGAAMLLAGLAINAAGGLAAAADLKSDDQIAHHPIYRPTTWSGLYFGANLGYGAGNIKADDNPFSIHSTGAVGGVHAGYNWQIRNFLLGAEGDFNWSAMSGHAAVDGDTAGGRFRNFGSVRGRVGAAYERLLIYATAGYGWTDVGMSFSDGVTTQRRSRTDGGIVYGTGIEYKLSPRLSLRGEAQRYEAAGHWSRDDGSRAKLHTPATEVRAGLTWHFNSFR